MASKKNLTAKDSNIKRQNNIKEATRSINIIRALGFPLHEIAANIYWHGKRGIPYDELNQWMLSKRVGNKAKFKAMSDAVIRIAKERKL